MVVQAQAEEMLNKGGAFLAASQRLNLLEKVSVNGYSHTCFHSDKLPMEPTTRTAATIFPLHLTTKGCGFGPSFTGLFRGVKKVTLTLLPPPCFSRLPGRIFRYRGRHTFPCWDPRKVL